MARMPRWSCCRRVSESGCVGVGGKACKGPSCTQCKVVPPCPVRRERCLKVLLHGNVEPSASRPCCLPSKAGGLEGLGDEEGKEEWLARQKARLRGLLARLQQVLIHVASGKRGARRLGLGC